MRRLLLPILILLVLPAAASAKTFCVNAPACVGDAHPTIKAGVDAADASPGKDRLEIGPGVYPGGLDNTIFVSPDNALEIVGAGRGQTIVEGWRESIYVATVYNPDTSISDMTLRISGDHRNSLGIDLNVPALVERVDIDEKVSKSHHTGLITRAGATIRDARVLIGPGPIPVSYGIVLTGTGGNGPTTISDVEVTGGYGISGTETNVGPVSVKRARVTASTYGMFFRAPGQVAIEDAAIKMVKHDDGSTGGNGISARTDGAGPLSVSVRHATVTTDNPHSRGLMIEMFGTTPVELLARDVALHVAGDNAHDLHVKSLSGAKYAGKATLRADYSAWRRNHTFQGAQNGVITSGEGNVDLEKSPAGVLVDNGTPGTLGADESPLDALGAPRLVDGDSDGVARRDIGASEAPAGSNPAPVAPVAMTAPDPPGTEPGGTQGPKQPADTPPSSKITKLPTRRKPVVSGVATDNRGLDRVELSVTRRAGARCLALTAKGKWKRAGQPVKGKCGPVFLIRAKGTAKWSVRLKGLHRGSVEIASRAVDDLGQLEVGARTRKLKL